MLGDSWKVVDECRNAVTKLFDYPMENTTELINEIRSANITCLDVLKGYWEISLEEQRYDLAYFKMHHAQYRWKVMLFGLCNAVATFQKSINDAPGEYCKYCKVYLDDIAIFLSYWNT